MPYREIEGRSPKAYRQEEMEWKSSKTYRPVKITASTFGTVFDLGYEISLLPNVALAFQAGIPKR